MLSNLRPLFLACCTIQMDIIEPILDLSGIAAVYKIVARFYCYIFSGADTPNNVNPLRMTF